MKPAIQLHPNGSGIQNILSVQDETATPHWCSQFHPNVFAEQSVRNIFFVTKPTVGIVVKLLCQ